MKKNPRLISTLIMGILAVSVTGCAAQATPTAIASTPTFTLIPPTQTPEAKVRARDGMVMAYVPAGEFEMGMDAEDGAVFCLLYQTDCKLDWFVDEEPVHTVSLDEYWIDRTEVTNGQYAQCEAAGKCDIPRYASSTRSNYYRDPSYAEYPVVTVTWDDAVAYCAWAGARLPTEAEWEKAARGGWDGLAYPWGKPDPSCSLANFGGSLGCVGDTAQVGTYPANGYGIFDMAGNVYEWVNDWYGETYYSNSPVSNPSGPDSGEERVLRGGSWESAAYGLRSANRYWLHPSQSDDSWGFRCATSSP